MAEVGHYDNVVFQVGNETFDCGGTVTLAWEAGVIDIVNDELDTRGYGRRLISTNSQRANIEQDSRVDFVNIHEPSGIAIHANKPTGSNEYDDMAPDVYTRELWLGFTRGTFMHYWRGTNTEAEQNTTFDRMEIFMGFINMTDFGSFGPLSSGVTGDVGKGHVGFLANGGSLSVNLGTEAGTFETRWIDPKTGSVAASSTTTGSGTTSFSAPGAGMWVLHLKKS